MSNKLWWGFGFAVVVAIVALVMFTGKSGEADKSDIKPVEKDLTELARVTVSDWSWGDISSKVVFTEYSDFQCPACAAYYPIIKQLQEKFGSKIGFAYRYFPLSNIHANADIAAQAAEAAGRQGKFWEMHDLLFQNQKVWSPDPDAQAIFKDYAKQLKLDEAKFATDLFANDVKDKILTSFENGIALNISGTPTFFLNGNKIPAPRSYEDFEALILQLLGE